MIMKRRIGVILVLALFILMQSGAALGAGNARKGKYLFRKHCRACHNEKSTGDAVGKPLSPISKTQAQWAKVFKNYSDLSCAENWEKLKEKGRGDVYAHLWGHAYDSPSPAKCQ